MKSKKATEETSSQAQEAANEEAVETQVVEDSEETLEEEITQELTELEELAQKAQEFEDKYLRAHAEMQNIARRSREERETLQRYRSQDLAKKILPSLDNLERALATEVVDDAGENLKKGIEMVRESLMTALKEEGVEEIASEGASFDPNLHQAVQTVPAEDGAESDKVVQVLQKGYTLQDRVLRPAMVVVSA